MGKRVRWRGGRSPGALSWGKLQAPSCNSREGWAFPISSWVMGPCEAMPGMLRCLGLEFHVGGGYDKNTSPKWGQVKARTHQPHNRRHFSLSFGWGLPQFPPGWWGLAGGSLMTAERVWWDYGGGEWAGDGEEQLCSSGLTSKKITCLLLSPLPQVVLSSSQPLCPNTLCTHPWLSYHAIIMCFNSTIPLGNGLFSFLSLALTVIFDIY